MLQIDRLREETGAPNGELGLIGDFLTGRLFRLEHGAPGILDMEQTYMGCRMHGA